MTPQLKLNLLQMCSDVVIPMMSIGHLNLDTILAVMPDLECTTMHLALTSTAIAQVAWEIASRLLLILKSCFLNLSLPAYDLFWDSLISEENSKIIDDSAFKIIY